MANQHAKDCINHMMNGGTCTYGKYDRKVFQGENGNFYVDKPIGEGITIFTGLFCKLKIVA